MYDSALEVEQYGLEFGINTTEDGPELLITFTTSIGDLTMPFAADECESLVRYLDAFVSYASSGWQRG